MGNIHKEDDNGADHIEDDHERDDFLSDRGNTLQAADYDQSDQDHDDCAGDPGGEAEDGLHIAGDGVHLRHVADAEGGDEAEKGEQKGQYLADACAALFGAQTVAEIVHRAAGPFALGVFAAVEDAEDVFGIVGHHAQEGHDPHPEHGAGAAHEDGAGHADDIAGADGGGQGGAETLELGDTLILGMGGDVLVLENRADGLFHPVTEMGHLEDFRQDRHQHADKRQQSQGRHTPDNAVDSVVYICYGIEHTVHSYSPSSY